MICTIYYQINGDTPLHTAVKDQNLKMVQLLLERRDIDPVKVNKVYHPLLSCVNQPSNSLSTHRSY